MSAGVEAVMVLGSWIGGSRGGMMCPQWSAVGDVDVEIEVEVEGLDGVALPACAQASLSRAVVVVVVEGVVCRRPCADLLM